MQKEKIIKKYENMLSIEKDDDIKNLLLDFIKDLKSITTTTYIKENTGTIYL